jgi:uncharacterized integral membrane protein
MVDCRLAKQKFNNQEVAVLRSDMQRSVFEILSLFIDILAFTDQNTNSVKVTLLAAFPDLYTI